MKIRKNIIIILLFLSTIYYLLPSSVAAQQISLTLSPPLVEIKIMPGKSALIAYDLQNLGDPTAVTTLIRPFDPAGDNGGISIRPNADGPLQFSLRNSEIKIGDPVFLKTKQKQQYLLNIQAPSDCPEGDYYYTFLAMTQTVPGTEGSSSTAARGTIGANLLITVTGSGITDGNGGISLFNVLPRFRLNLTGKPVAIFDSADPIPVILTARNQGRNLIKAQGNIFLSGAFGTKAEYTVIQQNILAQSQRTMAATPSAKLRCDGCSQKPSLVIAGFHLGRYRLMSALSFGDNQPPAKAYIEFIALPFRLGLGTLAAMFASALIIRQKRRTDD